MFVALAGSELPLSSGTTQAPPPLPSNDLFLSPTFVQSLATELAVDPVFGPILRGAAAALGRLVDRCGAPVTDPAHTPKGGTFLVRCGLIYRRGQGAADRLCIPAGGGLLAQVLCDCHDSPLAGILGVPRRGRWCGALPCWWARIAKSLSTCARTRRASAPRRSTEALAGSCIPCSCRRGAAG